MLIVLPGFFLLRRTPFWIPWLLCASYVFYGWWNPYYLILIAYSTTLDYLLVTLMDHCPGEPNPPTPFPKREGGERVGTLGRGRNAPAISEQTVGEPNPPAPPGSGPLRSSRADRPARIHPSETGRGRNAPAISEQTGNLPPPQPLPQGGDQLGSQAGWDADGGADCNGRT